MTLETFVNYEQILKENLFTATNPTNYPPTNFVRSVVDDPSDVCRVYLNNDGGFKAYNHKNEVICHGSNWTELDACI